MSLDVPRLENALLGEDRRLAVAAAAFALGLALLALAVEYLALTGLANRVHPNVWLDVAAALELAPVWRTDPVPYTWVYGYLLAAGLAAAHAYVNRGYLTSVVLALAAPTGAAVISLHAPAEYVIWTPERVLELVLPHGLVVATVGVALGTVLRYVSASETDDEGPAGHSH